MHGDGTHVTNECDLFRGTLMLRDLGIFVLARRQPQIPSAARGYFSNSLIIGSEYSPTATLAVSTQDVTESLNRAHTWRANGAGSDFASFDSRNNSGNPSAIPAFSQVGPGNAGLVGTSATTLAVRTWSGSNMNTAGDLSARSLVTTVVTASVSGTYTIPVTTGTTFRITTTGTTTFSAANGIAIGDGQIIYLEVVRGSGNAGVSYSFSGHFQFPGGVAPTIGSTASTQDFYIFQYHGNWKCISPPQIAVP